jgi:superfamily II DNA or RNA helicase
LTGSLFDLFEAVEEERAQAAEQRALALPAEARIAAPAFELYPYQRECHQAIGESFLRGVWSQIVVLPTGAGKTEVFARLRESDGLAAFLDAYPPQQQQILVVAHRDELIKQAVKKFTKANPGLIVGIEKADQRAAPLCDVIVSSIQTLQGKRLESLDPRRIRIVIIDEAHHAPAKTYQALLRYLDLLPPEDLRPKKDADDFAAARAACVEWWEANHPQRLLLGVTATPSRGDAIGLEWSFRSVVYEKTLRWMIENGYLAALRGIIVNTALSLDGIKMVAGDFNQAQLAEAVNTPARNLALVSAWAAECRERKTLAFTVDIQHARDLAAAHASLGLVGGDWISGDDPDREIKLKRYARGELRFLANAQLLTEGFDDPTTSCVLIAKPTRSQATYIQMVGRGTRRADGKADCVVIDGVDVSKRHSLTTLGDLFGLPARFDLRGKEALQALQEIERLQEENPGLQIPAGASLESVRTSIEAVDLWQIVPSERITRWATLRWVEDSATRLHLPLPEFSDAGAIQSSSRLMPERIELQEDVLGGWKILRIIGGAIEPLGVAGRVDDAIRQAEAWVRKYRPRVAQMQNAQAAWVGRKASDKQRAFIRTRMKKPAIADNPALTRGEAAALMDRWFAQRRRFGKR